MVQQHALEHGLFKTWPQLQHGAFEDYSFLCTSCDIARQLLVNLLNNHQSQVFGQTADVGRDEVIDPTLSFAAVKNQVHSRYSKGHTD